MVQTVGARQIWRRSFLLIGLILATTTPAAAQFVVTNTNDSGTGSLRQAMQEAATNPGSTITFSSALASQTITPSAPLPVIDQNTVINGSGAPGLAISGDHAFRVFFVQGGTVTIENLTIKNGLAQGGAGGTGGGGGMGAGGAIYVNAGAAVTVSNVDLAGNAAIGGAGGTGSSAVNGGGGGGLGGGGGQPASDPRTAGFGGGGGYTGGGGGGGANGPSPGAGGAGVVPSDIGSAGQLGNIGGDGGGLNGGTGGPGGDIPGGGGGGGGLATGAGGDGGAGFVGDGAAGTAGGGGGSAVGAGGDGGAFGGGGGGLANGGKGGFGGGGGGAGNSTFGPPTVSTGGAGGFGGGGGGALAASGSTATGGIGGSGGGSGGSGDVTAGGSGGGGAAFGGAIFVASGGSLTIGRGGVSASNVTAGTGGTGSATAVAGTNGAAAGQDLFLATGSTVSFSPGTGNTFTVSGTIADDSRNSLPSGNSYTPGNGAGAAITVASGTVELDGADTYAGGTSLTGGAIRIGNDAALGSGGLTMGAGTTLEFTGGGFTINNPIALIGDPTIDTGSGNQTVSGVISGTNAELVKQGTGSLTLTNTETYTGQTTVDAGTLALTGSGSIAASSGLNLAGSGAGFDITAGGNQTIAGLSGAAGSTVSLGSNTLTVNDSTITTFAGTIQGDGGLAKQGTGSLVLTGANTYTGGTTITAGTLQLGAGGTSGSVTGNVTDNGTLAFDRSDTTTFDGSISGSGMMIQGGSGTLVLDGNSGGFSGTTTVAAGTLEVGDAANSGALFGGSVLVEPGATLMGHGTIGGPVSNAGTVQPGGSIGVLTVAGNYSQTSAGTLTIEITPNVAAGPGVGYDHLQVGGSASLAGTLNILDDPGTYTVGSRYTLLTSAGARTGTFSTVRYNRAFAAYITPVISYDPNNVYLILEPAAAPVGPSPLFNGGQIVPDTLTAMVTSVTATGAGVLSDVCGPQARRLVKPGEGCVVRPLTDGYRTEVWMRGLGGLGSVTGSGTRLSFTDSYGGVLIGAGLRHDGFTLGGGAGYLATQLTLSNGSDASQNAGLGFIYGRYAQGHWWFGGMAAYGGGQVNGTRVLPGTGLSANDSRPGDFATVQLRAAYDLPLGPFTAEPRAGLLYAYAGQGGFSETGASLLDLTYAATHADVTAGYLAVRGTRRFAAGGWALLPWIETGVQETFSGLSRDVLTTAGAYSAGVAGVSPSPTAALVGVGLTAGRTDALDLFVQYQGQLSADQTQNAFSAGLLVRF